MIVAEDLMDGSCVDDSPLEARVAVGKFCGGRFLMGSLEDTARNYGQSHGERLEPAESASVNETLGTVPHWAGRVVRELVGYSSCSSSSSRCRVAEVGREEPVSSIYSGAE